MSLEHWFALLSICLLGAMSPGPSLAVVLSSTLGLGRSAGFQTAWAHGAGVALYGLLTVTGLALIVTSSPGIFLALQVAGALYLIYLGTKSLRQALGSAALEQDQVNVGNPATAGFLVAFLNPKLAVFMLALFSQFLDPTFGFKEKGGNANGGNHDAFFLEAKRGIQKLAKPVSYTHLTLPTTPYG